MKQLLVAFLLFAQSLTAQEFLGIKIDGTRQQMTSQLNAKGFKVNQNTSNAISFKGELNGEEVEVITLYTPKSGKCWKLAVYLPEQTSWYNLKAEYNKYLKILKEKYGEPSNEFNFFSSPYYEGDGYELSAVRLDKCTYKAFWKSIVSIAISTFKQVLIRYENPINSKIDDREKAEIDSNIF